MGFPYINLNAGQWSVMKENLNEQINLLQKRFDCVYFKLFFLFVGLTFIWEDFLYEFGVFDLAPTYLWFCCTHAHKFMQPVSCFSGQVRVMPTGGKPLCLSQT